MRTKRVMAAVAAAATAAIMMGASAAYATGGKHGGGHEWKGKDKPSPCEWIEKKGKESKHCQPKPTKPGEEEETTTTTVKGEEEAPTTTVKDKVKKDKKVEPVKVKPAYTG